MSESGTEPNTSKCSSLTKDNGIEAKRLLPKELRKRRRLAKLQVTEEKKARISLDSSRDASSADTSKRSNEASEKDIIDSHKGPEEKQQDAGSTAITANKYSPVTPLETKTVATATRLNSLYASSLVGAKKHQRLSASVPSIFQVAALPLDVVPKAKLSILTAFPYPFLRINSQTKKQALQNFVAGSDKSTTQYTSPSIATRWQQALHYFAYPADMEPTSKLFNRTSGPAGTLLRDPQDERRREDKSFVMARWNLWQEAFRDVYMNFRQQSGDGEYDSSFYVRSSDFVVYFQYETATSSSERIPSIIDLCQHHDPLPKDINEEVEKKSTNKRKLCAVMSQSSERTRKILHHLNVNYVMPYVNANQTQREAGEFHMLAEELEGNLWRNESTDGIALMASTTYTPEKIHSADSLLLFHGHDDVHGLYEFLINRAPMSSQDVPELYALHPFANASIRSLQVKSFGRVGGALDESLPQDQLSKPATLFRIEILGFCFPLSIARILAVLKDKWEAVKPSENLMASSTRENSIADNTRKNEVALRTYMEAVAGAERLNAVNLDEQVANGDGQEVHSRKRQQELEFSKRRLEVVVVARMESSYSVETTSSTRR